MQDRSATAYDVWKKQREATGTPHFEFNLFGIMSRLLSKCRHDGSDGWSKQLPKWQWVKTLAPSEHQNRWYMDVHPPKYGIIGFDPWPNPHCLRSHITTFTLFHRSKLPSAGSAECLANATAQQPRISAKGAYSAVGSPPMAKPSWWWSPHPNVQPKCGCESANEGCWVQILKSVIWELRG